MWRNCVNCVGINEVLMFGKMMMNKLVSTVVVAGAVVFAQVAAAATVAPTYQSGVLDGNDSQAAGQANLVSWIDSLGVYEAGFSVFEYEKVNSPDTSDGFMTVTYDGGAPSTSGTWSWSGADAINFVVFKSNNNFVGQYYDPGLYENMWDTATMGLENKNGVPQDLSHLTLYGVDGTLVDNNVDVVPLPAAGFMLLAGIGGLGAMRRFKKS